MTLDAAERLYLDNEVIGAYNAAIVGSMGQFLGAPGAPIDQLPIVDFNAKMDELRAANQGATWHFLLHRVTNPTGTVADWAAATYFSLDGVHPNNKGYAFVANAFLEKINQVTGSSWPTVPVDAFVWDPTYGAPMPTSAGNDEMPRISAEVIAAMKSGF